MNVAHFLVQREHQRRARARRLVNSLSPKNVPSEQVENFTTSRYNIIVKLVGGRAILFNARSRHMCVLNAEEYSVYCQLEAGALKTPSIDQKGFISALVNDGYLLDAIFNELDAVKHDYDQVRYDSSTLSLTIAPTMACNLACGYCYQGLDKDLSKIRADVPEKIFKLVEGKIKGITDLSVTWYGGEPLMGKDTIFRLSDRLIGLCDLNGVEYGASIVTNGVHLTPDIALQLYTRRCTSAQVTIDGTKSIHDKMRPTISGKGSYDVIIKNICNVVRETPMAVNIRVNVGEPNISDAELLLDEIAGLQLGGTGRISMYFAPLEASTQASGAAFQESLTKAEFNAAILRLKEHAIANGLDRIITPPGGFMGMCVAAKQNGYVVSPNGDLHKCWETAHDPSKRVTTLDNHENFEETPNGALWANWSPFDNQVCTNCKILPMCGGMCGHRFVYNGEGDDNALPCPDWKWNTAEYLFSKAKHLGHVTEDEWLPNESSVLAQQAGIRHSDSSLREAQNQVLVRVNSKNAGPAFTRDYILNADGRFFEGALKDESN